MSFYAYVECTHCGTVLRDIDHPSHTNPMCNEAMAEAVPELRGQDWLDVLNGMTGEVGIALLGFIIRELEAQPAKYDALNTPNPWANRDTIVTSLRNLIHQVPAGPVVFRVSR